MADAANMTSDQIGEVGELLAALALSRPVLGRYRRPLFRPTRLGGKYPVADFIVDVLGDDEECLGFFFVQVKATTKGGRSTQRRLPLKVDRERLGRLAAMPIPTYLVGVDLAGERSYVVAAYRPTAGPVYSMTKRHGLADEAVRVRLYDEVRSYWSARRRRPNDSGFHDD